VLKDIGYMTILKCARRWWAKGRQVRIVMPDDGLSDMNDVLLRGADWHVVDHQRPSQ
jgi:hypothetical protein